MAGAGHSRPRSHWLTLDSAHHAWARRPRTRIASAALTDRARSRRPKPRGLADMLHPLTHGIDTYWNEYVANRRRVATVLLAVSGVLFALILLLGRRVSEDLGDPKRFGFEGPKHWV